jgi:hypothetical protein
MLPGRGDPALLLPALAALLLLGESRSSRGRARCASLLLLRATRSAEGGRLLEAREGFTARLALTSSSVCVERRAARKHSTTVVSVASAMVLDAAAEGPSNVCAHMHCGKAVCPDVHHGIKEAAAHAGGRLNSSSRYCT